MERISIEETAEFAEFEACLEASRIEAETAYLAYVAEGYPFSFEDFMNGVTI